MSERHEAGQPWGEFLQHLDEEHWGSRNPAFIPADEPMPEEEEWGWEATPAGVAYLAAMELGEAKIRLDLVPLILDRILEQTKRNLDGPNA